MMASLLTRFLLKSYIATGTLMCYLKGLKPLKDWDIKKSVSSCLSGNKSFSLDK
jgi:hypothetical protein